MKKTRVKVSELVSNLGFQAFTGVLDIVNGAGLYFLAAIIYFGLPFYFINIAIVFLIALGLILNHKSLIPRVQKKPSIVISNPTESKLITIISIITIIGGIYTIWVLFKSTIVDFALLGYIVAIYAGISVMSLSLTNNVNRLMVYGQLVVVFTLAYFGRISSVNNFLVAIMGFGFIVLLVGLFRFRSFNSSHPM